MWDALLDIAERQGLTLSQLVSEVYRQRGDLSFTAAIRVRMVDFYRSALEQAEGRRSESDRRS